MAIVSAIVTDLPFLAATDVVTHFLFEKGSLPTTLPARALVEKRLRSIVFTGEWGTSEVFALPGTAAISFLGIIGLGSEQASATRLAEGVRRGVGKIVQEMRHELLRHLVVDLRSLPVEHIPFLAASLIEAAELVTYRFTDFLPRLQQEQSLRSLQKITLVVPKEVRAVVKKEIQRVQLISEGVELTRQLVNQPASSVVPATLVEIAQELKRTSKRIKLKVLNRRQAEQVGFNAFLAVARGSYQEPYVIHLTYQPSLKLRPARKPKKVILVGKGITFDSGGLSLKPAEHMETMKIDMAGAATVLGIFSIIEKLDPTVEVHGIIAACENMPSGSAYRPGDVLRAMNGKTIEVLNTDAEGRITLADALSYAVQQKPDAIIDLATLTGAAAVALGETHAALFSNNEALRESMLAAAAYSGEGLAALPLPEEYNQLIESRVADVRNISTTRYGGAVTAALFLQNFVNTTPWAHLDIAGPAYAERPLLTYFDVPGATGYGVRLLAQYLQNI